eukprot:CAMPEP_0172467816 /NCGR_PEP_ID=MMETSP1065-20121228/59902_1 /TAXON_ID=265537 /ORGANISM="Amphiprora paludosa, Strain CCMP125" /LENGTH=153 /DNA_ID=CAMNT_0013225065 /DNA_START=103 /DNA_END=560 /DNA_ORIENTATION=+
MSTHTSDNQDDTTTTATNLPPATVFAPRRRQQQQQRHNLSAFQLELQKEHLTLLCQSLQIGWRQICGGRNVPYVPGAPAPRLSHEEFTHWLFESDFVRDSILPTSRHAHGGGASTAATPWDYEIRCPTNVYHRLVPQRPKKAKKVKKGRAAAA